jgi:hypothetical protein
MLPNQLSDLCTLWKRLLGDPVPADPQFELWAITHTPETIKFGIMKTCRKNLQLGGTMDQDHKIRYSSTVMLRKTFDPQKAWQRPLVLNTKEDQCGGQ